jgi:23S rRNA (uridine2552-2'-O)-methyltransferase
VLHNGDRVVDLGCCPGGWSSVAANKVLGKNKHNEKKGQVIGIDLTNMDPVPGATFIHGDIRSAAHRKQIVQALIGGKADVVVSDMAPATCGDKQTDHIRIIQLCAMVKNRTVFKNTYSHQLCDKDNRN